MSDKHYWYGYLEAGEKSSPVLRDTRLDTGDSGTLYLFNLKRGEILEYKKAIIESKLRELGTQESDISKTLKTAYVEARGNFVPRGSKAVVIPARGGKPTPAANDDDPTRKETDDDYDESVDMDEWLEEEEA